MRYLTVSNEIGIVEAAAFIVPFEGNSEKLPLNLQTLSCWATAERNPLRESIPASVLPLRFYCSETQPTTGQFSPAMRQTPALAGCVRPVFLSKDALSLVLAPKVDGQHGIRDRIATGWILRFLPLLELA